MVGRGTCWFDFLGVYFLERCALEIVTMIGKHRGTLEALFF